MNPLPAEAVDRSSTLAAVRAEPWRAATALTAAIISITVPACGFDDQLTRRGFIQQGDALCEEAIGRTFQVLQGTRASADPAAEETAIRSLGSGYATIASGLRELDLDDEDSMMRGRMVERYSQGAAQLDSVADDAAAGDPAARERAIDVIDRLQPFAQEVRDYGFNVCGGREPTR
jgi:hypothetical protein